MAGVAQQIHEQGTAEVRDAEMADVAFVDELLERFPGLPEWDGVVLHLAFAVEEPARWVAGVRGDVGK